MRILTVVGARPQFVKAAPVSRALRQEFEEVLLHTGQHYDEALSDVFFEDLRIPAPDVHLGVRATTVGERYAEMTRGISRVLRERDCDAVLVYGDTDSTLAGALAARLAGCSLIHVEAGLRSFNQRMPEELNRIVTDHLSDLLLCPTSASAEQARIEQVRGSVVVVGDVMLDACQNVAETARAIDLGERFGVEPGEFYSATLHRAENTDDRGRLAAIVGTLGSLDRPVLLPCHPRTRAALDRHGLADELGDLRLLEPVRYAEMLALVLGSRALLTDSGGLQKEALFLGVPCVTLRDETEWTETVEQGWNTLVGADPDAIRRAVDAIGEARPEPDLAPFGGGRAAERVADAVRVLR